MMMTMKMVTCPSTTLMTQTPKTRTRAGNLLPLSAPPILHHSGGGRHSAMFCGYIGIPFKVWNVLLGNQNNFIIFVAKERKQLWQGRHPHNSGLIRQNKVIMWTRINRVNFCEKIWNRLSTWILNEYLTWLNNNNYYYAINSIYHHQKYKHWFLTTITVIIAVW